MNRILLTAIIMLCCWLFACEPAAPTKPPRRIDYVVTTPVETSHLQNNAPDSDNSASSPVSTICTETPESTDFQTISDGSVFHLKFPPEKNWKEADLLQAIFAFARSVYDEKNCGQEKIFFQASGEDGVYFEGALAHADYELYRKGKISQAELGRRVDLKAEETVSSLKAKIIEARNSRDHGRAITFLDRWLEKEPRQRLAQIIKANATLDKKDFTQAVSLYEKLLKEDPLAFDVWFNLAFAKRELGLFTEAHAIYQKLLDEFDAFSAKGVAKDDLLLHAAETYLGDNLLDESDNAIAQIQNQETLEWKLLKASVLRAQKKFKEALELLTETLKNHPDSDLIKFNIVLCYLDLQDKDGARKAYEELQTASLEFSEELAFLPVFSVKAPEPAKPDEE